MVSRVGNKPDKSKLEREVKRVKKKKKHVRLEFLNDLCKQFLRF